MNDSVVQDIYTLVYVEVNTTGIILTYYTDATYTDAAEAAWIDRDGNGAVTFEEWMLFNSELKAWTEQLAMAANGATALVTADVITNSAGKDSGFF
jgi:hypothetical protein